MTRLAIVGPLEPPSGDAPQMAKLSAMHVDYISRHGTLSDHSILKGPPMVQHSTLRKPAQVLPMLQPRLGMEHVLVKGNVMELEGRRGVVDARRTTIV